MWMLGLLLLAGGAAALYGAVRTQRRVHAMLAAETLSVPELEQLRGISDELGARGGFRKVCEVVGAAHPSPAGLLRAELTGIECVWHARRVQRRYRHHSRDEHGRIRVSTRTETVAEQSSAQGFALIRDGHTIGVDLGGRRPDGAEQVADRFEPGGSRGDGWANALGGARDETLGYQHTEWVLRPGTPLYVLGEVHDATGPLVIAPPADGSPFVLSTRPERQLIAADRSRQKLLAWGGAALAVAGPLVLVFLR